MEAQQPAVGVLTPLVGSSETVMTPELPGLPATQLAAVIVVLEVLEEVVELFAVVDVLAAVELLVLVEVFAAELAEDVAVLAPHPANAARVTTMAIDRADLAQRLDIIMHPLSSL